MIRIVDTSSGVTPAAPELEAYYQVTTHGDWLAESRSYGRQVVLIKYWHETEQRYHWSVVDDVADRSRTIDDGADADEAQARYRQAVLDQVAEHGAFDMSDVPGCGMPEKNYIAWTRALVDLGVEP